jgi:hypothetical protein
MRKAKGASSLQFKRTHAIVALDLDQLQVRLTYVQIFAPSSTFRG